MKIFGALYDVMLRLQFNRTRVFALLRAWSTGQDEAALALLDSSVDSAGEPWTAARLRAAREAHRAEHTEPEAGHADVPREPDPVERAPGAPREAVPVIARRPCRACAAAGRRARTGWFRRPVRD